MPGETHFFDDIYLRRRELGDIQEPGTRQKIIQRLLTLYDRYYEPADQQRVDRLFSSPAVRNELVAPSYDYCDVLSRFMEAQMRDENKSRWGNNAPRDLFNITEIATCFPAAKFIICIRDVRDFLYSYKNKWKTTSKEHKHRLKALYHPVVTSLLWKSSMRRIPLIQSEVSAQNLMIVRYEDLVTQPETWVRKMCTFLGEEFEADMLKIESHNSSLQVSGSGIFSTSVGSWRTLLGREEAFIAQWVNGGQLTSFGYQLEPLKINPFKVLWLLLSTPLAVYRALSVNKEMRGGSAIAYMYRRLVSLFG
jgi:hypothetical protein